MRFHVYQRTERAGREKNEDRLGYSYTKEAALFVVADGMGGHAHGELASQIAIETMSELFKQQAQPTVASPYHFLLKSTLAAHHQILQFANDNGLADSPRTTMVALLVQNGGATWVHCGDSRLYWFRGLRLLHRTLDHSYVEQKPIGASITAELLAQMSNRNVLFTCLGAPMKPIYEVSTTMSLAHGDRLLLCSDGLWGHFLDTEIEKIVTSDLITQSVPCLIDLALKRGGRGGDNVSAIGIEWDLAPRRALKGAVNVLTDELQDGDYSSSIHPHLVDVADIDQHDLDIDQSLREINEAIQKSYLNNTTLSSP